MQTPLHIPDFEVPAFVARFVSTLPGRPPSLLMAATLNRLLGESGRTDENHPLHQRHICIHLRDAGISFHLRAGAAGFRAADAKAVPDAVITASMRDMLRIALREEDPDTLFFNRRLVIEGDTEAGLAAKNLLDSLDASALKLLLPKPLRKLAAGAGKTRTGW